jgi:DNA-binding MarR family transcriptional regulator
MVTTRFIEHRVGERMDLGLRKDFGGFLPVGQVQSHDLPHDLKGGLAFRIAIKGDLTKAKWCRQLLRARRDRNRFFGEHLFGDPAWDMLLELYAAELSQRRVSVGGLAAGSGTPMTTALRWIDALVKDGLAERRPDPLDARRVFVSLTKKGSHAMDAYLQSLPPTVNPLNDD